MTPFIERAAAFAHHKHGAQKRKYTGEPYVTHTRAVAHKLWLFGFDEEVVAAGELHDTVEDTDTTLEEIAERFSERTALFVHQVTDQSKPSDGNRRIRKAIDRDHVARAGYEGQSIKLADLIDNTSSITTYDPNFAQTYMMEKALLLPLLTKGHPVLLAEAQAILQAWETRQVHDALKGARRC
jgi:(p)ppGpp synthase/HD superfamily hydrolase